MQKSELITIRDYIENEDKNFIFSTWLNGLFYGHSYFSHMPKDLFMTNYHRVIGDLLENPNVTIRVACLKEDTSVILGYAVSRSAYDTSVLDYMFVKPAWRKIGIAKSLLPQNLSAVTHLTKPGAALLKTKLPTVVFNPFLIELLPSQ